LLGGVEASHDNTPVRLGRRRERRLLGLLLLAAGAPIGLHPGPDLDSRAAAELAAGDLHETEQDLEHPVDAHLLEQVVPGRYRFHDLLRWLANDLVLRTEPEPLRRDALTRLFDYYLHGAALAADHLDPRGRQVTIAPTGSPARPAPLSGYDEALAWCETEHANLTSAVAYAAEHGWHTHAWQMPILLWHVFLSRAHHRTSIALHQLGLTAAVQPSTTPPADIAGRRRSAAPSWPMETAATMRISAGKNARGGILHRRPGR
jgi:hypothetical protein